MLFIGCYKFYTLYINIISLNVFCFVGGSKLKTEENCWISFDVFEYFDFFFVCVKVQQSMTFLTIKLQITYKAFGITQQLKQKQNLIHKNIVKCTVEYCIVVY